MEPSAYTAHKINRTKNPTGHTYTHRPFSANNHNLKLIPKSRAKNPMASELANGWRGFVWRPASWVGFAVCGCTECTRSLFSTSVWLCVCLMQGRLPTVAQGLYWNPAPLLLMLEWVYKPFSCSSTAHESSWIVMMSIATKTESTKPYHHQLWWSSFTNWKLPGRVLFSMMKVNA